MKDFYLGAPEVVYSYATSKVGRVCGSVNTQERAHRKRRLAHSYSERSLSS